MLLKRGLIFLVFLLAVDIVNSEFEFKCEDGTLFGSCNLNGELCGEKNLIFKNRVDLKQGSYVFFGETDKDNCRLNIGDVSFNLADIGKKIVGDFNLDFDYSGNFTVSCDGNFTNLDRKYLGVKTNDLSLNYDFNFCGIPDLFVDYVRRYINADKDEREKLKEEMRALFGFQSGFFGWSITGGVIIDGKEVCTDFDNSGKVDFDDFFLFADVFGLTNENTGFDARFDLNGNKFIDLDDFFLFADDFGRAVECGGGIDCLELIPNHNKLSENRIDLVLVAFNYEALNNFLNIAHKIIEDDKIGLFFLEPFKSNKNKFNVWYVNKIGIAEDIQPDKQGVILGKDAYVLSDICTKKLGYFREELTPQDIYFSTRMFNIFIVNKGVGGSAFSTPQTGNVELLRNYGEFAGLKGATVHIPEEGKPIYHPNQGDIQPDTQRWYDLYNNKLRSFAHEFAHAFTIEYPFEKYLPSEWYRIFDEYYSDQDYSEDFDRGTLKYHSNCFAGTLEECQSASANELFGDLIGNGCGEDGVIDCCTNDVIKITNGARSCISCPSCHEDTDYNLEVSCYQGCTYKNVYRATFDSIMRGDTFSFGLVNERLLQKQIDYLTDELGKATTKEYFKFTFENWNQDETTELINYLCGNNDWKESNGVYECNFDNGNELDGVYELALDIFGEPYTSISHIKVIRDETIFGAGENRIDEVRLRTTAPPGTFGFDGFYLAQESIVHELLHSFTGSNRFSHDIFNEGMTEAMAIIIRVKLGENPTRPQFSSYDTYNKRAISTNDGQFSFNFQAFAMMQYGTAAQAWFDLYGQNANFFKSFFQEVKKNYNIKTEFDRDYFYIDDFQKLIGIVEKAMPYVNDIPINEWVSRNFIMQLVSDDSNVITPYLHDGYLPEFILINRRNPADPVNTDNVEVTFKLIDYNNNLVKEAKAEKYLYTIGSSYNKWSIIDQQWFSSQDGRYKLKAVANVNGDIYSDFSWHMEKNQGLHGVIVPYLDGTVTIMPENGASFTIPVVNGAFYPPDELVSRTEALRGKVTLRYTSPTGNVIAKTIYKTTNQLFVVINDEPFMLHEQLKFAKATDFPIRVSAKVYGSNDVYINYRFSSTESYQKIKASRSDDNIFFADIAISGDNIRHLEYFFEMVKENYITTYPDGGQEYPLIVPIIQTSDKEAQFGQPLKIVQHNFPAGGGVGAVFKLESGTHGFMGLFFSNTAFEFNIENSLITSLALFFQNAQFPESNGDVIIQHYIDNIEKKLKIYYPPIDGTLSRDKGITLYIAEDGSTYWKFHPNHPIFGSIDNPTFEDALRNGHLARAAPSDSDFEKEIDVVQSLQQQELTGSVLYVKDIGSEYGYGGASLLNDDGKIRVGAREMKTRTDGSGSI